MAKYFISFITTAVVFCLFDFVWLGFVAKNFYANEIGGLLLTQPRMGPAAIFYCLYVVGIISFAVLPALDADRWQKALGYGALLGLIAYATYDLSNLATLKGWSVRLTLVDMAWGVVATASAATAAFWLARAVSARFN